jgi:hypothetical protein
VFVRPSKTRDSIFRRARSPLISRPADLPKESGRFDLPIARGILAATGQAHAKRALELAPAGGHSLLMPGPPLSARAYHRIRKVARITGRRRRVIRESYRGGDMLSASGSRLKRGLGSVFIPGGGGPIANLSNAP